MYSVSAFCHSANYYSLRVPAQNNYRAIRAHPRPFIIDDFYFVYWKYLLRCACTIVFRYTLKLVKPYGQTIRGIRTRVFREQRIGRNEYYR